MSRRIEPDTLANPEVSAPLVAKAEVLISLTRIPRAALEDVRLAGHTLLMPKHHHRMQGCLASRTALPGGIGGDDHVVHLVHPSGQSKRLSNVRVARLTFLKD